MPGERGAVGISGAKGDRVSVFRNGTIPPLSNYINLLSFGWLDHLLNVSFFRVTLERKDLKVLLAKMVQE